MSLWSVNTRCSGPHSSSTSAVRWGIAEQQGGINTDGSCQAPAAVSVGRRLALQAQPQATPATSSAVRTDPVLTQ